MTKHSRALAAIRQLCCLGLDRAVLLPEILTVIQAVIPPDRIRRDAPDERPGPIDDGLDLGMPDIVKRLLTARDLLFASESEGAMAYCCARDSALSEFDRMSERRLDQSDCFRIPFTMTPIPRSGDGGAVADACRFQSLGKSALSAADLSLFEHLAPWIEHALCVPVRDHPIDWIASGLTGLLIMQRSGAVAYLDEGARHLLQLACHGRSADADPAFTRPTTVPPALLKLCRDLEQVLHGRNPAPSTVHHTNPGGRFIFSASWLDPENREDGAMIGVTIEHLEPLGLRLFRGLRALPLSPTQSAVCLLLAQDYSHEDIAQRLHLKRTTLKEHVRRVYQKLDIHRREDLRARLLGV